MSRQDPISPDVASLRADLETVAALVSQDRRYIPVFERLEEELAAAMAEEDTIERARRLLARKDARNGGTPGITPDGPAP